MTYEVAVINPKTNTQRKILAELSSDQIEAAKASPCFQTFVQAIALPDCPDGFLFMSNGVRAVTLQ